MLNRLDDTVKFYEKNEFGRYVPTVVTRALLLIVNTLNHR